MKHPVKFFLILLILMAFISGCVTVGSLQIEVVKPAKIEIPSQIKRVAVVNTSIIKPTTPFTNPIQQGLFRLDTTISQEVIQLLSLLLNDSPRIDSSLKYQDIYYRKASDLKKQLSKGDIDLLCKKKQADALISLEALAIDNTTKYISVFNGLNYSYQKAVIMNVSIMWRIYHPDKNTLVDEYHQKDTLIFDEFYALKDFNEALNNEEALDFIAQEVARQSATKMSDRIAPYWVPVSRDFFNGGNTDMQMAAAYAYRDQWMKAATIWKKYTQWEKEKVAAAACHNMALAAEVNGELELALKWLEKAVQLDQNYYTLNYLKIIKMRLNESEVLDEQFGIE